MRCNKNKLKMGRVPGIIPIYAELLKADKEIPNCGEYVEVLKLNLGNRNLPK